MFVKKLTLLTYITIYEYNLSWHNTEEGDTDLGVLEKKQLQASAACCHGNQISQNPLLVVYVTVVKFYPEVVNGSKLTTHNMIYNNLELDVFVHYTQFEN